MSNSKGTVEAGVGLASLGLLQNGAGRKHDDLSHTLTATYSRLAQNILLGGKDFVDTSPLECADRNEPRY